MGKAFAIAFIFLLLGGCANTQFAPNEPYFGLTENSYGPLRDYVDSQTQQPVGPPLCDPTEKYSDVNELSRQITAIIFSPVARLDQIDPSIKLESLQSNFKMPGDPLGYTVTLLDRDRQHIVFWYRSQLVTLPEVTNAACQYCGYFQSQAVYEGSAEKCSQPERMPVAINGNSTMIETYVISSFLCVALSGGSTTSDRFNKLVLDIQTELVRLGYLHGMADGRFGPHTKAAIELFEKHNGMTSDGQATPDLLQRLRVS